VTGDLPHRLIEEFGGNTEVLRDHHRELRRLAPVERKQGGQRHEHRQPDAGRAVVVDAEAAPVTGGHEARIADGPPPALADVAGGLEIDERDGVIGPDHDVEHVQIVKDHASFVHHVGRTLYSGADPQGPGRIGGDLRRIGLGHRERVAIGVTGIERLSLDEFLGEEVMLADLEVAADLGRYAQAGQPSQDVVFSAEPGYRVRAVGRRARMRPGLLEDHPLPGPLVHRGVDAAAVGEVQRLLDVVGESGDGHRVAGDQVRREEARQTHPGRHGEPRCAVAISSMSCSRLRRATSPSRVRVVGSATKVRITLGSLPFAGFAPGAIGCRVFAVWHVSVAESVRHFTLR
jgi:hypothetical protein